MKLSIIVPVYNEALFIRRCLESIKLEPDIEVIIIDDGSTDGSWDIIQEYCDAFKKVRLGTNCGVSYARTLGIMKAHGEYITFLDADDALTGEGVRNMLKAIDTRPDAAVIQLDHYRCKNGVCSIEARYHARPGDYGIRNLPPKWAPVWNKLYRREFLKENGIFFPIDQQFDEDRVFNIQCLKHSGGIAFVDYSALKKYFDNENSLCHTIDREKIITALRRLVAMLEDEHDPEILELIKKSITMHLNSDKFNRAFQEVKK